jgi:hypothetical protein
VPSAQMAIEANLVDEYAYTGESCPDLCKKYDIEVREFVLLACLQDLGVADAEQLQGSVGLSPTTVRSCVINLLENGLMGSSAEDFQLLHLTADGRALLRRASGLARGR